MWYKQDWEKAKERLEALWQNEIIDRCCVAVLAPRHGKFSEEELPPKNEDELFKYYTDGEWLLKRHTRVFENTYFGGEAFPCIWPNFGTAGHAKYFKRSKFRFAKDTVWFTPSIYNWEKDKLEYDPESEIFTLEKKTMEYLAKEGKGKFFVTMPDNCGIIDALAHLRGSDKLLLDLLDNPHKVIASLRVILEAYKASSEELFRIIQENNENGSAHGWMYTWAKGRHAQLQVDFSVMISPEMFEEFALPELEEVTDWLDYSIYHLDGQEQIRHLEMILSVKKLNMIQWTPVAGQPLTSNFIHIFKRIQKAGKGLVLFPEKKEIETILTELSPKGLYLIIRDAESENEAKNIIRKVRDLTKQG